MIYQRMNKNEEENPLNFKEKHFFFRNLSMFLHHCRTSEYLQAEHCWQVCMQHSSVQWKWDIESIKMFNTIISRDLYSI